MAVKFAQFGSDFVALPRLLPYQHLSFCVCVCGDIFLCMCLRRCLSVYVSAEISRFRYCSSHSKRGDIVAGRKRAFASTHLLILACFIEIVDHSELSSG